MKVKRVLRYYCEFCKKSGGGKAAMIKHEKHCTMNPDRECRMCPEDDPADLKELIALLPDPNEHIEYNEYGGTYLNQHLNTLVEDAMIEIRKLTDCPACILSALRQKGIPVPLVTTFDYRKESKAYLSERDNEPEREVYYGI